MRYQNAIIVDYDEHSVELLLGYCEGLPFVDLAGRFVSPIKFIELLPVLDRLTYMMNINYLK